MESLNLIFLSQMICFKCDCDSLSLRFVRLINGVLFHVLAGFGID